MSQRTSLTETEIRFYLMVSLIYEKILENEPSFEMGFYRWGKIRPDLLQSMGMGEDSWEEISDFGDTNDDLQERLGSFREKYVNLTLDEILQNISKIKFG